MSIYQAIKKIELHLPPVLLLLRRKLRDHQLHFLLLLCFPIAPSVLPYCLFFSVIQLFVNLELATTTILVPIP